MIVYWIPLYQLKNLTKSNWNISPSHGLHMFCKTLWKRKTSTQNLWSVKTKSWKNFITAVTKTIKIFYLHSSKGLKKSISQISSMKTSKIKRRLGKFKNFMINEAKKTMTHLLILLIPFLSLLLKLLIQKSNFQRNHFGIFCHQEWIILS